VSAARRRDGSISRTPAKSATSGRSLTREFGRLRGSV
jgi:hypothetical protein